MTQPLSQGLCLAAVQMVSGTQLADNLARASHWVQKAAEAGAELVLLPEYFCLMGHHETDKLAIAEPHMPAPSPDRAPIQAWASDLARRCKVTLVAGTVPLRADQPGKVRNTMLVYGPQGQSLGRYDKAHLFSFQTDREQYDESRTIEAGDQPVMLTLEQGRLGLSVCYDLRFPEFYRAMDKPDLILVSAAFTETTGRAHWELLLRARAVENQCWLLASAQGGVHENGRRTWGQSMLVNPWGEIQSQLAQGEGLVLGRVDHAETGRVRLNLPALQHRRF